MPPVATTTARASIAPVLVRSVKPPPSRRAISSTRHGMRQATPPCPHSARNTSMMVSLLSSQNSCPRCFSCQCTRWRRNRPRKSCGV
ncbi:Uncharacterised protein [Bordetella pertussis]|nr:Uncharacterised protein [Bordetella pertussis]